MDESGMGRAATWFITFFGGLIILALKFLFGVTVPTWLLVVGVMSFGYAMLMLLLSLMVYALTRGR